MKKFLLTTSLLSMLSPNSAGAVSSHCQEARDLLKETATVQFIEDGKEMSLLVRWANIPSVSLHYNYLDKTLTPRIWAAFNQFREQAFPIEYNMNQRNDSKIRIFILADEQRSEFVKFFQDSNIESQDEFIDHLNGRKINPSTCFRKIWHDSEAEPYFSIGFIIYDKVPSLGTCINGLLFDALGMWETPPESFNSFLNDPNRKRAPTEIDWAALKLLYHPDLNSGLTEKEFLDLTARVCE